jgi:hypothetical protein
MTEPRGQEHPEQRQWQAVPDEIEQDEPAAEPAHIPDEIRQIAFRKVMAQVHRECHICERQRVAPGVCPHDRDGRGNRRMGPQVHANRSHPQHAPYSFQDQARSASHVEHPSNRQGILANCFHDEFGVAHPMVDPGEIAISAAD